jgi:hypothetical protein
MPQTSHYKLSEPEEGEAKEDDEEASNEEASEKLVVGVP